MDFEKGIEMKRVILLISSLIIVCSEIPTYSNPGSQSNDVFEIVIVDVTDRDIAKYGRFPWSRDIYGKALRKLNNYAAKGVYFDYIISESDSRWPEKDKAFADEIESSKIPVFLPYVFVKEGGKEKFSYEVKGVKVIDAPHVWSLDQQVLPPISQLAVNTTNMGFINVFLDKDDILREVTTVVKWRNRYYPFIGIPIAAHYKNVPIDKVFLKNKTLHIGSIMLQLRNGAKFRPTFRKPFDRYKHISYSDLFEGNIRDKIKAKFVIMSFNATGLSHFFVTPNSNRFPGSEIIAGFLDDILNKTVRN